MLKRTKILLASGVAGALMLFGGVAYASIPGPDGVIHGCVASSGKVLIIDSAASCPSGQTALNWNQTGPQGPAGADGAPGADGVVGTHMVSETFDVDQGTGQQALNTPHCGSGEVALSGGYQLSMTNDEVAQFHVVGSYNDGSLSVLSDRWHFNVSNTLDHDVPDGLSVFAVCAEVN